MYLVATSNTVFRHMCSSMLFGYFSPMTHSHAIYCMQKLQKKCKVRGWFNYALSNTFFLEGIVSSFPLGLWSNVIVKNLENMDNWKGEKSPIISSSKYNPVNILVYFFQSFLLFKKTSFHGQQNYNYLLVTLLWIPDLIGPGTMDF